ncbi:MAG: alanine racemase [Betaproteobacteria bacterium]|jgi:alanine racemase
MTRPIKAFVDTNALKANLSCVRHQSAQSQVLSVVKANAYGHGIERVFEGLKSSDGFGVLEVCEAQVLRDLGFRGPIVLLEGVFGPRELEDCSRLQLWHAVHCSEQIDWLSRHKTHKAHRVFLKMNSGMNRLGFKPAQFKSVWSRLNALPQVEEISLMTHFSDADLPGGVQLQQSLFEHHTQDLIGERSLANSASLFLNPLDIALSQDWVRVGIALYGGSVNYPSQTSSDWDLKPVMSFRSKVIATQDLKAGDTVGYGSTFTATQPMKIGIVACGYADGYPRSASTGTPILVNGHLTQTLGRVSMDMLTVDLSPLQQQLGQIDPVGAEVTLWGAAQTGERLDIDVVAHHAKTLAYELMCGLATRVPFEVIDSPD